jgi:hypothetical protein
MKATTLCNSQMQRPFKSYRCAVGLWLAGAVLVATGGQPSLGVAVVDQSFVPSANTTLVASVFDWSPKGQTFTVGIPGTLTEVDVYIARENHATSALMLGLLGTTAGVPDDGQQTLSLTPIPAASVSESLGWLSIDISSYGVTVAKGEVLAIELVGTTGNNDYQWYGDWRATYSGGNAFAKYPSWASLGSDYQLGFKTYVEPIPEPSGSLLLAIGFGILVRFSGCRAFNRERNDAAADHIPSDS